MANKEKLETAFKGILDDEKNVEEQGKKAKGRPRVIGYERRTFQVRSDLFFKLKSIAAREGILQKDLLEFFLTEFVNKYEKKHGEIETRTALRKNNEIKELF